MRDDISCTATCFTISMMHRCSYRKFLFCCFGLGQSERQEMRCIQHKASNHIRSAPTIIIRRHDGRFCLTLLSPTQVLHAISCWPHRHAAPTPRHFMTPWARASGANIAGAASTQVDEAGKYGFKLSSLTLRCRRPPFLAFRSLSLMIFVTKEAELATSTAMSSHLPMHFGRASLRDAEQPLSLRH